MVWLYGILLLQEQPFTFSLVFYCKLWLTNSEPNALPIYLHGNHPQFVPRLWSIRYHILGISIQFHSLETHYSGFKKAICPSLAGVARERFSLDPCEPSGNVGTACNLTFKKGLYSAADCAFSWELHWVSFANSTQEGGREGCTLGEITTCEHSCNSTSSQLRPKNSKIKETKAPLPRLMNGKDKYVNNHEWMGAGRKVKDVEDLNLAVAVGWKKGWERQKGRGESVHHDCGWLTGGDGRESELKMTEVSDFSV